MFSFKINKKTGGVGSSVQVPKSLPQAAPQKAFIDEDDKGEEEPDFIDGLDGTEIVSKHKQKKAEKKELVIPLITKNEWRIDQKREKDEHRDRDRPRKEKGTTAEKDVLKSSDKEVEVEPPEKAPPTPTKEEEEDALKQQAIKELLEETSSGNISTGRKNNSTSIPLLFQNKVPEGYEEEDNMDVSLRPDQATLDDYERIPIDEFGKAMLRGMGWKEEEGIGLRNKQVVDMAEPKIRPKGMGLGAEAAHTNKDVMQKNLSGNDNDKEDLTLKIGGFALINRGSKKGYYGQIESFDEDNNRVILRLAISGKMEAVSKFYIDVVSAKEYKKSSKVINSEKYEEYKSRQDNNEGIHQKPPKEERVKESRSSRSSSRSSDEKEEYRSRSRRKEKEDYDDDDDGDDYRSDRKRSRHRHDDKERSRKSSKKDRKDRHESKHEDRHRSSSHKDDEYYKSSVRNGDTRSDHHSKKDDYHRERKHKHKHSSRSHRD